MSNFSYLCNFPVGLTILDLTDSGTTIANLDLEAARTFRERAQSQGNPLYNIWDDNYVGTMWPVGMSLEDAMYYYWNSAGMTFSGISANFYTSDETVYMAFGSSTVYPTSSFRNVFTNYDCPEDGYNANNFGDQYYALKLVNAPNFLNVENPCLTAQSIINTVEEYNYNACTFSQNEIDFREESFNAFFSYLNGTFYGGSGTRYDLTQKYPSIIKIENLYYPAIHVSFLWSPTAENNEYQIYGAFNASTYHVLRNQEITTICDPPTGSNFSYEIVTREDFDGPYNVVLEGFPSGNTYNIPIYNIYTCSGDLYEDCPNPNAFFSCESIPFNVEIGTLELLPR